MGLLDGFFSLGAPENKLRKGEDVGIQEGAIGEPIDPMELSMSDEELIELKKKWEGAWDPYEKEVRASQNENEEYWLGKQFGYAKADKRPIIDNLIFESLETFLPIATRQNPQPMVVADNTEEGIAYAQNLQRILVYHADRLRLKLRIKRVVRNWALYMLGYVKVGWSMSDNDIATIVGRPQDLILDPDATINDDMEYTGYYIGQRREDPASTLIARFPKQKAYILQQAGGKEGTKLGYIEWWTDDYVFWTLKNEVLGKNKNPHWNYETQERGVDEFGQEVVNEVPGRNHFNSRKKPFIFLSIFNLGKHPHDDTNMIRQNLSMQDGINKRWKQIDKNVDGMNGGWGISGEASGLSKEQASQAIEAIRKGGGVYIPKGDVNAAVSRLTGTGLPADVFNTLVDSRNELRNIFGVRGSNPAGTTSEQTVRGKIIVRSQDADRIGGGISEYIEQFADHLFNWWVQLIYVYYDEPHTIAIIGDERAAELISIQSSDMTRKVSVSVKEGSLIPSDQLTKRNEAIDLYTAGALDPITLYDRLDFPNPREAAKRLLMWKMSPLSLFPDLQPAQPPAVPPVGPVGDAQQQGRQSGQGEQPPSGAVPPAAPAPVQMGPIQG